MRIFIGTKGNLGPCLESNSRGNGIWIYGGEAGREVYILPGHLDDFLRAVKMLVREPRTDAQEKETDLRDA